MDLYVSSTIRYRYRGFDGTSSATPLVAGIAVLVAAVAPSLTGVQIRDLILATVDVPRHPDFALRFKKSGVGIAHGRAVHKAVADTTPGTIVPFFEMYGGGVETVTTGGVPTTHLRRGVELEINGFATDPITSVALYLTADGVADELVYSGPPRGQGDLLPFAAARLAGKKFKLIVSTAQGSVTRVLDDVVGHAVAPTTPPTTKVSPPGGTAAGPITLTAIGEHPPFVTRYRWDSGPWATYAGPIPVQSGVLSFYSLDALGNVEGGVDHGA